MDDKNKDNAGMKERSKGRSSQLGCEKEHATLKTQACKHIFLLFL
jgi:hypothetical protein